MARRCSRCWCCQTWCAGGGPRARTPKSRRRRTTASALFAALRGVLGRLPDDLLQHLNVHVVQALDVQAAAAARVLAQLFQQRAVAVVASVDVQSQRRLARREADQAGIALVAAGVLVVIAAVTDDAGAPHLGLEP